MLFLATTGIVPAPWHPHTMVEALISATVFGLLGLVILLIGFKLFEWITPRLDIEKELGEKNVAVAVVVAGFMLAIGFVIAKVIGG